MINLKVLSTVAAMALVLPMVTPTESFAQQNGVHRAAGGHPGGRPGGGVRPGGGGGPHFSGGGYHRGGGYRGGGGGALIGAGIAGAVIGGAIASQGGYGPGYYAPGPGYYNDPGYDDGGAVAVAPAPDGDDAVAYCMQTYRSYDPRSGTYMGNDGYRHPCP
jgi:BA14K-like protein